MMLPPNRGTARAQHPVSPCSRGLQAASLWTGGTKCSCFQRFRAAVPQSPPLSQAKTRDEPESSSLTAATTGVPREGDGWVVAPNAAVRPFHPQAEWGAALSSPWPELPGVVRSCFAQGTLLWWWSSA